MQDFSDLFRSKRDRIIERWITSVIGDERIVSSHHLTRSAIQNHIEDVLEALASVLSQQEVDDTVAIAEASLSHGVLRAGQGYDPAEIAQEYHLLRQTIFEALRDDLLQSSASDLFRAVSLIDAVVDAAISACFRSYVEERLQELQDVQQQLSMTVDELQRLIQTNQDNLSFLAHEMKTPLTSIIGYADLFLRQSRSVAQKTDSAPSAQPETTHAAPIKVRTRSGERDNLPSLEHIERVLRAGRTLLHVINDALELSQFDAKRLNLHIEETDVRSLIETVIDTLEPLAKQRGLALRVNYTNAPTTVYTDPVRLQQVLTNLASNAVRYTDAGSVLIESAQLSGDRWFLSVTDTGVGIAPEDQLRLFNPFARAQLSEQPPPPDSTGLGLAIVARLVESLQGKIYLTSQVKEGSTFRVILPLALAEAP